MSKVSSSKILRKALTFGATAAVSLFLGAAAYEAIGAVRGHNGFHPDLDAEILRLASISSAELPGYIQNFERSDAIAEYYADPASRKAVIEFFNGLTYSENVTRAILENAERYEVPVGLAFALAYEESRFKISAVHDNGDSKDRGLFQLNSKAFPDLGPDKVFDPATNARYGLSHLQYFLKSSGNEVAALAMYNAGMHRVTKSGTPRRTLDYIYRILSYERNISSLFAAKVAAKDRRFTNLASLPGWPTE